MIGGLKEHGSIKYIHRHEMFDSHRSRNFINEAFRAEICLIAVLLHCC